MVHVRFTGSSAGGDNSSVLTIGDVIEGSAITTKFSLKKMNEIITKLNDNQKQAVRGCGFGTILDLKCSQLPRDLALCLAKWFDCDTRTVNIPNVGSFETNTYTVHQMLGIPLGGRPIDKAVMITKRKLSGDVDLEQYWIQSALSCLGIWQRALQGGLIVTPGRLISQINVGSFETNAYTVHHTGHQILGIPLGDRPIDKAVSTEASRVIAEDFGTYNTGPSIVSLMALVKDDLTGDKFVRVFMLLFLSTFLCPTSHLCASPDYFNALVTVDNIQSYDWCAFGLDRQPRVETNIIRN